MPATASISSSFEIPVVIDGAGTYNLTIGRTARITGIRVYNGAGTPNVTITKNGTANVSLGGAVATATNAWLDLPLDGANTAFTATDFLRVVTANLSTTAVVVTCIGNPAQALTVS
jgi:hypothetical protein